MTRVPGIQMLRFTLVAVAGLLLDLGLASTLAMVFGVPLLAVAVVGFVFGATFNYAVHETWTFAEGARTLSWRRWWR